MISKDLANIKRLGRYDNLSTNNNNSSSNSQSYFNEIASSFYKHKSRDLLVDWDKPLFGNRRTSLQKTLANANKAIEKSTKFIDKIKPRQLACANRAKSIPENAT